MTIKIADKFEVLTSAPIDNRMVVDSYSDIMMLDESILYDGMVVYTLQEQSRYERINGSFFLMDPVVYQDFSNGFMLTNNAITAITASITTDNIPEGTTNRYSTGGSSGNTFTRQTFIYSAYNVPANDINEENFSITTNFQVMTITASHKCRVRIYGTEIGRSNDYNRNVGATPNPIDSVMVDFVVPVANTEYLISPCAFVFSGSDSISSQIYFSTTNNETTEQTIEVTITYVNFGKVQVQV